MQNVLCCGGDEAGILCPGPRPRWSVRASDGFSTTVLVTRLQFPGWSFHPGQADIHPDRRRRAFH